MKPENRALLVIVMAVVAIAAVGGGYFLVTPSTPMTLIVPWGTVFEAPSTDAEFDFNVTPPGGTFVGAWASTGPTCVMVFPFGASIPHSIIANCIAQGVSSGTFNMNLMSSAPGEANLTSSAPGEEYMLAFLSDSIVTVRVTQTIQVVYS